MNIWIRRLFIITSIGGGFLGLAANLAQLFRSGQAFSFYFLVTCASCVYAYGVFAGLKFVENEAVGMDLLSWFSFAQIPTITSPVLGYLLISGFSVWFAVGNTGFHFNYYVGSSWTFSFLNIQEDNISIGVNFFALWATWYLRKKLGEARANQSPDPALASVTPPAEQEARLP